MEAERVGVDGVEGDMAVSGGEVGGEVEERQRESWLERVDQLKSGAELRRAWKMAGAGGSCRIMTSSTEAEYMASSNATMQAIWLRNLLNKLNFIQPFP